MRSLLLLGLLSLGLAAGSFWTVGAATGTDMVEVASAKAQSLADLIAQRSPGVRTEAQLTKHARALAKLRPAPKLHGEPATAPAPKSATMPVAQLLGAPPLSPVAVDLPPAFPLAELSLPSPSLGAIVFPGPGSSSSPPGGGSSTPTFPGTPPGKPIVPPPAVPEPGTWATMLLGFGLIGWRMRAAKRLQLARR
ncbi:MAG TPA: PEPxxWA-CTERM sorting domain-containing protein [Allosphingosinicella sp.]